MAVVGLAAEVLDEPGGVGAGGELGGEDDQLLALPQSGLQEGEGLLQMVPHLGGGIGPEGHVGLEVGFEKVKGGGAAGGGGLLQVVEQLLQPGQMGQDQPLPLAVAGAGSPAAGQVLPENVGLLRQEGVGLDGGELAFQSDQIGVEGVGQGVQLPHLPALLPEPGEEQPKNAQPLVEGGGGELPDH